MSIVAAIVALIAIATAIVVPVVIVISWLMDKLKLEKAERCSSLQALSDRDS